MANLINTDYNQYDLSGLGARLAGMAQGTAGPSAAERQLQAGLGSAQRRAQGFAATSRAVNPALAQRQALAAGSQMSMDANQQAAIMRAQEQQQALAMQMALEQYRAQQQQAYDQMTMKGDMFNANQRGLANQQMLQLVGAGLGAAGSAAGMAF